MVHQGRRGDVYLERERSDHDERMARRSSGIAAKSGAMDDLLDRSSRVVVDILG